MDLKDRNEVKAIIKDELDKFISSNLDSEVKKKINNKNSKVRNELTKLIKDSIESVFKVLWQKRDFWKTDIR